MDSKSFLKVLMCTTIVLSESSYFENKISLDKEHTHIENIFVSSIEPAQYSISGDTTGNFQVRVVR